MKHLRYLILYSLIGLTAVCTQAQTRLGGQLYTQVYAWEPDTTQQWDFYQGFRFDIRSSGKTDLRFKTNLRFTRRGDPYEWKERVYNTYLDWFTSQQKVQLRLGRQFTYFGVINGSADALMVRLRPVDKLDLRLIGGVRVPYDRTLKVQSWDDGGLIGGLASYRFAPLAKADVSYVQHRRAGATNWQQLGLAVNGAWKQRLNYQTQFDYNLLKSTYQGIRLRFTYQIDRWRLLGEYNDQKPRVFEDSYFNIFQLVAFRQLRTGIVYRLGKYELGAQYLYTAYHESADNNRVILTVGSGWGTIGVLYQNGYGGDNVGLYANVLFDVLDNLAVKLHTSYFNYQVRNLSVDQDATAFAAGLQYRPIPTLILKVEAQQSLNTIYDNDWRALFGAFYTFR